MNAALLEKLKQIEDRAEAEYSKLLDKATKLLSVKIARELTGDYNYGDKEEVLGIVQQAYLDSGLSDVPAAFKEAAKAGYKEVGKTMELTQEDADSFTLAVSAFVDLWDIQIRQRLENWVIEELAQYVTFSVSGDDLAVAAQDEIDSLSSDADALLLTGLVAMTQESLNTVGKDSEYWLYDGPDDDLCRPFCAEHVGHTYTTDEMEALEAEEDIRYNCRHEWVPVDKPED